jgi:hypothetical protein
VFKSHGKRFWAIVAIVVAALIFITPALLAFRYTAAGQRDQFITHPWRGWSFAWAAIRVPGNSQLKTSGAVLRKAQWLFRGTGVDPQEVQLLYVHPHEPYTFTHTVAGRTVTSTITPTYWFVWQVEGQTDTAGSSGRVIVAMFDYRSGKMLYDVRSDLQPQQILPEPGASPSGV